MIKSIASWGKERGLSRMGGIRLVNLLYPDMTEGTGSPRPFNDDQERALNAAWRLWEAGMDSASIRHAALAEVAKPGDFLVIVEGEAQTCSPDLLAEVLAEVFTTRQVVTVVSI